MDISCCDRFVGKCAFRGHEVNGSDVFLERSFFSVYSSVVPHVFTRALCSPLMASMHRGGDFAFASAQCVIILGRRSVPGKGRILCGLARARAQLEPQSRFVVLEYEDTEPVHFTNKFWTAMRRAGRLLVYRYQENRTWWHHVTQAECVFLCLGMGGNPSVLDCHLLATCKTITVSTRLFRIIDIISIQPRDVVWLFMVEFDTCLRKAFVNRIEDAIRTRRFPALASWEERYAHLPGVAATKMPETKDPFQRADQREQWALEQSQLQCRWTEMVDCRAHATAFWSVATLEKLHHHVRWSRLRSAWVLAVAEAVALN